MLLHKIHDLTAGGKHDAYWFTTCSLRRWPHEYQSLLQGDQLWLTGLEGKHTSLVKSLTECEQALLTSRWAQTFFVWEKYILMLTSSYSLCTDFWIKWREKNTQRSWGVPRLKPTEMLFSWWLCLMVSVIRHFDHQLMGCSFGVSH